jgi:hypothetical protein
MELLVIGGGGGGVLICGFDWGGVAWRGEGCGSGVSGRFWSRAFYINFFVGRLCCGREICIADESWLLDPNLLLLYIYVTYLYGLVSGIQT